MNFLKNNKGNQEFYFFWESISSAALLGQQHSKYWKYHNMVCDWPLPLAYTLLSISRMAWTARRGAAFTAHCGAYSIDRVISPNYAIVSHKIQGGNSDMYNRDRAGEDNPIQTACQYSCKSKNTGLIMTHWIQSWNNSNNNKKNIIIASDTMCILKWNTTGSSTPVLKTLCWFPSST